MEEAEGDGFGFGDVWQLNFDAAVFNEHLEQRSTLLGYDDLFGDLYARRRRLALGDRVKARVAFLQWREEWLSLGAQTCSQRRLTY